jgi:hypothetical protein
MTRPKISDAVAARRALAVKYDRLAKEAEDAANNADPQTMPNVKASLTALAQRRRTYAATARKMAGDQPTADDAASQAGSQ